MSFFKPTREELEKRERGRENAKKLYAAAAEKARTLGGGKMVITEADIKRVSNDLLIQDLLDARENPLSDKAKNVDFKTEIRKGRLESARKQGTHTHKQWLSLLEEFDYRCLRCGCQPPGGPTKDHIIPISMGGSDSIDNLQPLCLQCNSSGGGMAHSFNWVIWRRAKGFGLGTDCFCWMKTISDKNL